MANETYAVILEDPGDNKLPAIKAVYDQAIFLNRRDLGLKECKDIVDLAAQGIPQVLPFTFTYRSAAFVLRNNLVNVGAVAYVQTFPATPEDPEPETVPGGNAPDMVQFRMHGYFRYEGSGLYEALASQGLSGTMISAVDEDGRFGRHGEVEFTCLIDRNTHEIQVIDCSYLD